MKPLYFGNPSRQLFGVYHPARSRPQRESGVLLCAPVGQESIRAHRTFRQLATMLSQIGFPVLRFDYFGHGDSAGESAEGSVSGWITDVQTAADELKDLSGVHRISWVGFRFGATLAVLAAKGRRDLDALLLVEPVLDGRAYLNQLREMHIAFMRYALDRREINCSMEDESGQGEAMGWPLAEVLRQEIAATDPVSALSCAARKLVLISAQQEGEDERRLLSKAAALGIRTATIHEPGCDRWNQEILYVPMKALQSILAALG